MSTVFWLVVAAYLCYTLRVWLQERRLLALENKRNLEMETIR